MVIDREYFSGQPRYGGIIQMETDIVTWRAAAETERIAWCQLLADGLMVRNGGQVHQNA